MASQSHNLDSGPASIDPFPESPLRAQSVPDASRRHSLPAHYLPTTLWNSNPPPASIIETSDFVQGEHTLDEATIAHRISALRQLNGATATRTNHRYAKSTGARNSTFSQPVIVRTYSESRPASRTREKPETGVRKGFSKGKVELPPLEAFTFKGIMDSIQSSVAEDLERIAEICARSRYSLSNQYEVHMPPHGVGEGYLVPVVSAPVGPILPGSTLQGPTLQATESDDEGIRTAAPRRRQRRVRSMAQGTLETIYSSSKSSEEEKAKKGSASVLAEKVRGRVAKKTAAEAMPIDIRGAESARRTKSFRTKSATFASAIVDNAQGFKHEPTVQLTSPSSLLSDSARPQPSMSIDHHSTALTDTTLTSSPILSPIVSKPTLIRNESMASTLRPQDSSSHKTFGLRSLSAWLPWGRAGFGDGLFGGGPRSTSHAEGALRDLLRARGADGDRKGKGIVRGG